MRERVAAIAMSLGLFGLGCDTFGYCDRDLEHNPFVLYADGTAEGGVYMSAPWEGPLLDFPGGAHYELEHKLGERPRWISAFLSFDEIPSTEDGQGLGPAAGNQFVVLDVDDRVIRVKNDECVAYWLLVTAGSGEPPAP